MTDGTSYEDLRDETRILLLKQIARSLNRCPYGPEQLRSLAEAYAHTVGADRAGGSQ